MNRSPSRYWLPAIMALIVASFVTATAFVHWRMRAIDASALDIANNAAPSIERLSSARAEARHLQLVLDEQLDDLDLGRPFDARAVEDARAGLDRAIDDYLALPALSAEHDVRHEILDARHEVDRQIARIEAEASPSARRLVAPELREQVRAANDRLIATLRQGIELNAESARDQAVLIRDLRSKWSSTAMAFDIACTGLAIGGAVLLHRVARAHAALVERHRALQEERASELEHFAGRVAHDILSPLGTVSLSMDLASRAAGDAERQVLQRGHAALARVKTLVNGMLDFARAGGRPDPAARADLGATLSDIGAELRPVAAEAHAELVIDDPGAPLYVACHPGVLSSLVANLTRNAIKYIGDGPLRRIHVHVAQRASVVHVEVEDTGPGLAPEIEERVFEPYVRAPNATQPGVGLGLATVKRLAEAHGGRVGVRTRAGLGSTFWFELPAVAPPTPS
ncbi:MAG: HAMP domain-containing histidine kinase [Labilithrix sp.]|nr:HAMP domain-containing histidine kinase [Labilithrix sp.]